MPREHWRARKVWKLQASSEPEIYLHRSLKFWARHCVGVYIPPRLAILNTCSLTETSGTVNHGDGQWITRCRRHMAATILRRQCDLHRGSSCPNHLFTRPRMESITQHPGLAVPLDEVWLVDVEHVLTWEDSGKIHTVPGHTPTNLHWEKHASSGDICYHTPANWPIGKENRLLCPIVYSAGAAPGVG